MEVREAAMMVIKLHIDTYGACKKSFCKGLEERASHLVLRADGQYFDEP